MHSANGGKDHVNSPEPNLKVTILKNWLMSKVFDLKDWKDCQVMRLSRTAFLGVRRNPGKSASWLFSPASPTDLLSSLADTWPAGLGDGILHLRWLWGH